MIILLHRTKLLSRCKRFLFRNTYTSRFKREPINYQYSKCFNDTIKSSTVKAGNDQEMEQSERNPHSKNKDGKN